MFLNCFSIVYQCTMFNHGATRLATLVLQVKFNKILTLGKIKSQTDSIDYFAVF